MNSHSRLLSVVACAVLVGAAAFLVAVNRARIERVSYVTGLARPDGTRPGTSLAATEPGQDRRRDLIVPERNEASFELIAQTHQMLAEGPARIRHVDSDNAPAGRAVWSTSPARWWLGAVAWLDQRARGTSLAESVEHAALYAGPLWHGLAFLLLTAFTAWRFGALAATCVGTGLVTFFPLAARFLPGAPDPLELARVCALAGPLALVAGMVATERRTRWFALAGIVGGIGAWLDVSIQLTVVAGAASGGLLALFLGRNDRAETSTVPPAAAWRAWAVSGAATVMAAYLVEYFPAHLGDWHPESVHPVGGLVWIAIGELLAGTTRWRHAPVDRRRLFGLVTLILAVLGAAVPIALSWSGSRTLLARNLAALRLTDQPDGVVAANAWEWLGRDGAAGAAATTFLPVLAILPALWFLSRPARAATARSAVALALMPVIVALGIAIGQLNWWTMLDATVLVLAVAGIAVLPASEPGNLRWGWVALVALTAGLGAIRLVPPGRVNAEMKLTTAETQELIERDLAHWLARHADEPRPVVFAPPRETATLCFYGGLRGIGTFAPENNLGFGATLMIAGARTMEEVEAQVRARGIAYIVIPSWDPFFENFGRLYLNQANANRTSLLVSELRRWNLPLWLTPVAYPMPVISGFEQESVLVFAVVDPQNPGAAAARLSEYLVETGATRNAQAAAEKLRRYPGDAGALAALAQVQRAAGDTAALQSTTNLLASRVKEGADRFLAWDRRVSVAVALAQDNRLDLAKEQVRRCLEQINERRLRALSPGSLYRLLVLANAFGLTIEDPHLRSLALDLLPPDLRSTI